MYEIYGRYKKVRNGTWQVFLDFNISSLPVSVVKVATAAEIKILKNSDVSELKSNEVGASVLDGNIWYIIYDDTVSKGRMRFTIAHELGHIFLGHPLKFGYHVRTIDIHKPDVETDADMFASRLLCPACVLWGLKLHTPEEIKEACNISYTAAKIRAERMKVLYERNKFLTSPLEKQVYNNFSDYINERRKNK